MKNTEPVIIRRGVCHQSKSTVIRGKEIAPLGNKIEITKRSIITRNRLFILQHYSSSTGNLPQRSKQTKLIAHLQQRLFTQDGFILICRNKQKLFHCSIYGTNNINDYNRSQFVIISTSGLEHHHHTVTQILNSVQTDTPPLSRTGPRATRRRSQLFGPLPETSANRTEIKTQTFIIRHGLRL